MDIISEKIENLENLENTITYVYFLLQENNIKKAKDVLEKAIMNINYSYS